MTVGAKPGEDLEEKQVPPQEEDEDEEGEEPGVTPEAGKFLISDMSWFTPFLTMTLANRRCKEKEEKEEGQEEESNPV